MPSTRKPLIVNASANQIQELPAGDSLDGIVNVTATGTVQAEQLTSTDDANITGTVTANLFVGGGMVPLGAILMWSGTGTSTAVPTGFTLCDGNGGTAVNGITIPDLRDKFIVGANAVTGSDSTYPGLSMNQTGGSADAVVVQHKHAPTTSASGSSNNLSSQAEGASIAVNDNVVGNYGGGSGSGLGPLGNRHFMENEGVSGTDKNLPPYVALAYIIRTS